MDIWKIKKGDITPALTATLQNSAGSAIDLTGANSVYFIMGNRDYTPYYSGTCIITGSETGQVEYRWTGSIDTATAGNYWGEFEMIWAGSKMTLPSDHSLKIIVYEDYN